MIKLEIKDNKVVGPWIGDQRLYIYPTGVMSSTQPPDILQYHKSAAERSGKKPIWKVFPDNHPALEIFHLDKDTKVFWCDLDRHQRPARHFCISVDSGNNWVCYQNIYDMHWKDLQIKEAFCKVCFTLKNEFDIQTINRLKKEEKEKIKTLAAVEGITVTELRKRMVEDNRKMRLKKLERKESLEDVNEMKKRIEMATILKKMEANLEFLLGCSKQEESLNVTRFYQKVKTLKTMSSDLDRFVKKFNKQRKTK